MRNRRPSQIKTNRISEVPVPGVDAPVRNLFGVSQVLSWIAGQRAEITEDIEWRSQVHDLIAKLDVWALGSITTSAFEPSRWRGGRYRVVGPSIVARVRFGSQGGHCDPSQKADAG